MLGMKPDKLKGHLDLLLMEILQVTPGHGYAVIGALRDRTDGTFDLPESTVYPALHRLEDCRLLVSDWSEQMGLPRAEVTGWVRRRWLSVGS
jgi:PadR family transcriptional regulator, regulatory protein PadR